MKKILPSDVWHKRLFGVCAASILLGATVLTVVPVLSPQSPALAQKVLNGAPAAGFADLVEQVMPAVISIEVKLTPVASRGGFEQSFDDIMPNLEENHPFREFFERFNRRGFGAPPPRSSPRGSQGSGFIISADGYAVTNNHVVDNAEQVRIRTHEGETYLAEVVGTDPKTDLALLSIKADRTFEHVQFADQAPRIGDWVIAVGNPFGLGGTVTTGIISANGRNIGSGPYDDFLQIDAPINRGNSGGPAFNLQGKVVGVNTAIFSPTGGSVGIGFAIPAHITKTVVDDLRDDGVVVRGWLGVQIQPVSEDIAESLGRNDTKGALIADVGPSSPAEQAGLRRGDTILAVEGRMIEDARGLALAISRITPGEIIELQVWRNGRMLKLDVTIAAMPGEPKRAQADEPAAQAGAAARFGLTLMPTPENKGVMVADVAPASPSAEKGIRRGDVILEIAGTPVTNAKSAAKLLNQEALRGAKAVLMLLRSGENKRFVALPVKTG